MGWTFTVNGQAAPAHGFDYNSADCFTAGDVKEGTYTLRFASYDGKELGTMTVTAEKWGLLASLRDYLQSMQRQWENEDRTTREWLTLVGNDFMLLIGSPVVALMIFFCGPMGWVLIPVAFQPFIQLPMDIVGLFKSIFR